MKSKLFIPDMKGCSDHNCIFVDNSKGMHTNGGCQCEKDLRRSKEGFQAIRLIRYLRAQIIRGE